MLTILTAKEHIEKFTSGHSLPCLMSCVDAKGKYLQVVVKFRSTVHGNKTGLICEAMASMFAKDLKLTTPQPFIVSLDPDLEKAELDKTIQKNIRDSSGLNFGTLRLPTQYSVVPTGPRLPLSLYDAAAQVLAFDLLIGNADRHKDKPNCLMSDTQIAVLDHEIAFPEARGEHRPKPWEIGGLAFIQSHVFLSKLKGEIPDLNPIRNALNQLPKGHFEQYLAALPEDWSSAPVAESIVSHLEQVKNNSKKYFETLRHLLR